MPSQREALVLKKKYGKNGEILMNSKRVTKAKKINIENEEKDPNQLTGENSILKAKLTNQRTRLFNEMDELLSYNHR